MQGSYMPTVDCQFGACILFPHDQKVLEMWNMQSIIGQTPLLTLLRLP